MIIQRANFVAIACFATLITTNVNKATSLKCYICKSDEGGICWTSPEGIELEECESGNIEISSTTPSSSTTTLTTSTSTITNIPSSTQTISSSTSTGTRSSTQTTASSTSSNTPSITQTTSSSTSSNTPSSTQTTSSSTSVIAPSSTQATSSSTSTSTQSGTQATSSSTSAGTLSSTQATSSSTSASTSSTIQVASFEKIPFSLESAKYLRRKREIQYRGVETGHQCVKLIYKEGENEIVERKCILKTSGVPCEEEQMKHTDISVCEICDNEDGCNSSSNINLRLITMLLPFTIVYYMLSNIL